MEVQPKPLAPEPRRALQKWLDSPEHQTLRTILFARIALAKQKAADEAVKAAGDEQYVEDSLAAAREAVFYTKVLTLLASVQLGHNPDKPDEEFEYTQVLVITDHEPLTTKPNA